MVWGFGGGVGDSRVTELASVVAALVVGFVVCIVGVRVGLSHSRGSRNAFVVGALSALVFGGGALVLSLMVLPPSPTFGPLWGSVFF